MLVNAETRSNPPSPIADDRYQTELFADFQMIIFGI